MTKLNVTPTRMQLSNLKARLATASRGHKLLKDKQDELVRQFITLVRKNKSMRQEVEEELIGSFSDFILASSSTNENYLELALTIPKQRVFLDMQKKNVMSVDVPVMSFSKQSIEGMDEAEKSIYSYGFANTSADLDEAIDRLNKIMDKLLELAQIEKSCQLMADEIEETRRRVNALEYRTIPDLKETISYIRMKLDESERSTITRLMKIKDIIAKEAN